MANSKPVTKGQTSITMDGMILKKGKERASDERRSFSSYIENLVCKDIAQAEAAAAKIESAAAAQRPRIAAKASRRP